MQEDFLRGSFRSEIGGINRHLGIHGRLLGVRDICKLLDQPSGALGVKPLAIPRLAHLQRRRKVNKNEAPVGMDHGPDLLANGMVSGDMRADRDAAVFHDLRGHLTNASNVDIAMLS